MGKYLKMAGVFDLPVKQRHVHDENGYGFKLMLFHSVEAECAAHAINSHDELVAEVERLSSSLNHANSNHELFERQYYLEKDKCDDLQEEVERLREALQDLMDWTVKNSTAYDCPPYNAAHRLINK